jgi:putative peptidoglycan binding protein
MARVMTDFIEKSVGTGGVNQRHDVVRIQAMLNAMPPYLGGPEPRLKQDGFIGTKTIAAIQTFQRTNFGDADGRVDPGKRMEQKLVEFEMAPGSRPLNQIGVALDQARNWMKIAYPIVAAHIDPAGRFTDHGQRSVAIKEMFRVGFGHPFVAHPGSKRAITTTELQRFRGVFDQAAKVIATPPMVQPIKTLNTDDSLQEPTVHSRAPLAALRSTILVTYRLTDWDAVSGYGTGPLTRAGLLLQAAFDAGVNGVSTDYTANQPFIETGFADASLTLNEAARYNWFAQRLAQGQNFKFFHMPSQGVGWKDVASLP